MELREFDNIEEVNNISKSFKSDNLKDKKVIALYDEDKVNTIAFYHKPSIEEVNEMIEEYGDSLKSYSNEEKISDYDDWKEYVYNRVKDSIYLDYIESINKNKGGARKIIEYLENKFKNIWLYSLFESEEFYQYLGWQDLGEYVYINK